jgi:hypothetical protein
VLCPVPVMLRPKWQRNNPEDGYMAQYNTTGLSRLVVLHELGHALGMYADNIHPTSGDSPMREAISGPGTPQTLSANDKQQVALRW